MCMFCAAMPVVVSATAVAQDKQRRKLAHAEASQTFAAPRGSRAFTPKRITQVGALAFAGLLVASVFYHTHFPA